MMRELNQLMKSIFGMKVKPREVEETIIADTCEHCGHKVHARLMKKKPFEEILCADCAIKHYTK